MNGVFDLFLRDKVDASELLSCINDFFGKRIACSLGVQELEAKYLLSYLDLGEGFLGYATLISKGDSVDYDELSLASHVARKFNTDALFEPVNFKLPGSMEWCFVERNGDCCAAEIFEFGEEGEDVVRSSLVPL